MYCWMASSNLKLNDENNTILIGSMQNVTLKYNYLIYISRNELELPLICCQEYRI